VGKSSKEKEAPCFSLQDWAKGQTYYRSRGGGKDIKVFLKRGEARHVGEDRTLADSKRTGCTLTAGQSRGRARTVVTGMTADSRQEGQTKGGGRGTEEV